MSAVLRVEMLLVSFVFFVYIMRAVQRNIFLVKHAIGWLAMAFGLILFALFPAFPKLIAQQLGFETTANFLMLLAIFVLLILVIQLSLSLAKQQSQINTIVQELSILKKQKEKEE